MTDMTVEDLARQHEMLRAQVEDLKEQLQAANARSNRTFTSLQDGLMGIEDDDLAEQVMDFLNVWTDWEFVLEQEFEVECRMIVTVTARSAEAAEEVILGSSVRIRTEDGQDPDVQDLSVECANLA